jgi:AbrB family looped-hinge helix DNA binding protein
MEDIHGTIAEGGRIVIPAGYRRALGLKVGDEVILRMADGEVHVLTRRGHQKSAGIGEKARSRAEISGSRAHPRTARRGR